MLDHRTPFLLVAALALATSSCSDRAEDAPAAPAAPAAPVAPVAPADPTRAPQMTAELRDAMSPAEVYQTFKDGHERFRSGKLQFRRLVLEIDESSSAQHPYAIVLSCIDSRVPAETIFDKRIGDIFSTRIAGNVVSEDVLGGMEFATQFAGAKLIMVMGHTSCGAIKGAAAGLKHGNLTHLLNKIEPAVKATKMPGAGKPDPSDYAYVDAIAAENVRYAIEQIRAKSPELRKQEQEGKIKIVGTMYDIGSGRVAFYD